MMTPGARTAATIRRCRGSSKRIVADNQIGDGILMMSKVALVDESGRVVGECGGGQV